LNPESFRANKRDFLSFPPPFTKIARYYDRLMWDVGYGEWILYIEEIFRLLKRRPKRILDLACGTGNASLLLYEKGYEVVGIDLSDQMLEVARRKGEGRIEFKLADMRNFILGKTFDAVICLFDSLNNLLLEEDLRKTFERVFEHLRVGGVFLFDINTIYCLENYWDDKTRVREDGDLVSIWRSSYDPKTRVSTLDITLFVQEEDSYRRIDERHLERGYSLETIDYLLDTSGFKKRFYYDHLTFDKPKQTSLRVMVIAERGS